MRESEREREREWRGRRVKERERDLALEDLIFGFFKSSGPEIYRPVRGRCDKHVRAGLAISRKHETACPEDVADFAGRSPVCISRTVCNPARMGGPRHNREVCR